MLGPFLGVLGILVVLLIDEVFWRLNVVRGEASRKIDHIIIGSYIAIWPFMMSMREIQILAVAMLVVISISHRYHIFQSIHAIKRRTYGEYFFPISVGVVAAITSSPWIFMAAILHLSLADGLAAIVGSKFGKITKYRIFGQSKTLIGTAFFFVISQLIITIMLVGNFKEFQTISVWIIVWLPLVASLAEAVAVYGTDDLVVPILIAVILETLRVSG